MNSVISSPDDVAQEVLTLVAQAPVAITSQGQYAEADEWLKVIRKKRKEWEGFFDSLVKPFREAIKAHNEKCTAVLAPAKEKEAAIQASMLTFFRQQEAKRMAEQAKLNERFEKKVEKAIEKGKDPTAIAPPAQAQGIAKSQKSEAGTSTIKIIKKARLVGQPLLNSDTKPDLYGDDPRVAQLPDFVFILDWSKVRQLVAAGAVVPGAELWEDQTIAVR